MYSLYSFFAKRGQLFAILLGVAVVVIFLGSVIGGLSSAGYSLSSDLVQVMKSDPAQTFGFFDIGLYLTLALIVIAVVAALIFGLVQMLTDIKGSLKAIIALVVLIAVFFAFYSMASDDMQGPISRVVQQFDISSTVSKVISGGLTITMLLGVIAVASMILLEIWNAFK